MVSGTSVRSSSSRRRRSNTYTASASPREPSAPCRPRKSEVPPGPVQPHLAAVLDDLGAIAVELRLMQPGIALRDGLGGSGDAGADELHGHETE